MTVKELIERLMEYDFDAEVEVWWYQYEPVGEYKSNTPAIVSTKGYLAICPDIDVQYVKRILETE